MLLCKPASAETLPRPAFVPQSRRYPPRLPPFSPQHQNCRSCAELRRKADGAVRTSEQNRAAAWEMSPALATEKGTIPCKDLGYAPKMSPAEQSGAESRSREPAAPLAQASYETPTPRAPQMPPETPTPLPLAPRGAWAESGCCSADTEGVTPVTPHSDSAHECSFSSIHTGKGRIWPHAATLSISSNFCSEVLNITGKHLRFN